MRLDAGGRFGRQRRQLEAGVGEQVGREHAVPAAVGQHGNAPAAAASAAEQRPGTVDELARRRHRDPARVAQRGGEHPRRAGQRARVGVRRARADVGAAGLDHQRRLAGLGQRPDGGDERRAVLRILHVARHHPRRLVVDQRPQHVGDRQVGLVADGDEPREALPLGRQQQPDLEREVARLRDEGDAAGRLVATGRVQARVRVEQAEAVRAEQQHAGRAGRLDQARLQREALRAHLAEAGRDHRDGLHAEPCGVGHGALHGGRRDRQDHEIGRLVEVEQRRHGLMPEHVAGAPRDHADRRVAGLSEQADREPSAPLHPVVRGAHQRDRARLEQRRQVPHAPSIRSTPRFSRPRATISRWISEVPSQMRSTRSSRRNRSATLVRM